MRRKSSDTDLLENKHAHVFLKRKLLLLQLQPFDLLCPVDAGGRRLLGKFGGFAAFKPGEARANELVEANDVLAAT